MSKLSEEEIQEWKNGILKQQKSGISIVRWCQENNVLPHNFYYWKKRLFPKAELTRSCFTELADGKETGVSIEYQGIRIHVERLFDPSVLKQCLELLRGLTC